MSIEFLDADDFIAAEPPVSPWLWDQYIQERSLVLLNAEEKRGKSMFALNFCLAGALALPSFLGAKLRPGGFTSMYVQGEIHRRGVWERLVQMAPMGVPKGRLYLNTERNIALLKKEVWKPFVEKVRQLRPDFLAIDPLAHVMRCDENVSKEVGLVLQDYLAPLRDDPGCTIMLIHHNAKWSEVAAQRSPAQRARGSGRLTADPDTVISLAYNGNSWRMPVSRVEVLSRYSRVPPVRRVRLSYDSLWFEEFTKHAEKLERTVGAISSLLQNEWHTVKEVDAAVMTALRLRDETNRRVRNRTAMKWIEDGVKGGYLEQKGDAIRIVRRPPVDVQLEDEGRDNGE